MSHGDYHLYPKLGAYRRFARWPFAKLQVFTSVGNWLATIPVMTRLQLSAIAVGLSVFVQSATLSQLPAEREKVAEGEYWEWKDGHPLKDTTQTWTLWRTKDGYEVEDRLPPDQGAALESAMLAGLGNKMSRELREELQSASSTSNLRLQLSRDMAFQRLLLDGLALKDAKPLQVADCWADEKEISCKGRNNTARLKRSGQLQLVYSYPFPMLFAAVLKQAEPLPERPMPVKIALLDEVKNKLELTEVTGQLSSEGTEKITIGSNVINSRKYVLALQTKGGRRQITLWTANSGTVFAMEDSKFAPGLRVLLIQYKKYSDF